MTGREAFQEIDYRRDVRRDREVGGADRARRARARSTSTARSRPPRPGARDRSCSRCRRTCSRRRSRRTTRSRTRRCRPHPEPDELGAPARAARRRQAAARDRRRRRVDGAGRDGLARLRGGERASRRVPGSGCQDYVDNASRVYAGARRHRPDPKLAARVRDADLLLVVGARLGEIDDAAATRSSTCRPAAPDARPRPRRRRGARPRLPAGSSRSSPARRSSPRRCGRWSPSTRRPGATETEQAHADHRASLRARRRGPGDVQTGRRDGVCCASGCPDDAILTNGAGNFSVWAHRFYEFRRFRDAARADERRDGLRRARGGRGEARPPRAHRRLLRRRRRLPDERPGARDRRAVRAADRRARRQQRHVRHDPDAPGAALSRPRRRHRSRQPGLRRARARPSAATARWSSGRRSSRPRSSAPSRRAGPR